jgi:hypothetical protein
MWIRDFSKDSNEDGLKWEKNIENQDTNLKNDIHLLLHGLHFIFVIIMFFAIKRKSLRCLEKNFDAATSSMEQFCAIFISLKVSDDMAGPADLEKGHH